MHSDSLLEAAMSASDDDRREFLKTCGKFAAVTPPTLAVLLSTSLTSGAIAHSGGGAIYKGNNGKGNGGGDGSPNGKTDIGR